jgi:hypothetical protein
LKPFLNQGVAKIQNDRSCKDFNGGLAFHIVWPSPLFEIALVVVRLDHIARFIVNADQGVDHSVGFDPSPTCPQGQ